MVGAPPRRSWWRFSRASAQHIPEELKADSDVDMAVSGLSPQVYFSAVSQASDLIGRPVDLVDLDDDSALVRYLRNRGELVRVD